MAQQVKTLATKPGNLSLVPKIYMVEEVNQLFKLSSPCVLWHVHAPPPINNQIERVERERGRREESGEKCIEQ